MRNIFFLVLSVVCLVKLSNGQPSVQSDEILPRLIIDSQGHSGVVNALQFLPDGNTLISVSADKSIRFWDIHSGTLNKTIRTLSGNGPDGAIYSAAVSPDGQFLAIGGYFPENEIRIINLVRDKDVVILKGHTNVVTKLTFNKTGKLLASASADKTVKIWEMIFKEGDIAGKLQHNLTGHTQQVYDIAFAPNSKRIVSASADGSLRLWDLEGVKQPVEMKMHIEKVYSCAFSADGEYIISGGSDGKLIAWTKEGIFKTMMGSMDDAVSFLNFSTSNLLFAAAKDIKIMNVPSGTTVGIMPKTDNNITAAALFQDKYYATSASNTGDIIVRDLQNRSTLSELKGSGILPLEVASNDNGIMAIGNKKQSLSLAFDLNNFKFLFANFSKKDFKGAEVEQNGYTLVKTDPLTLSTGFKGTIKNSPATDGRILNYTIIDNENIAVGSDFSIKIYSRDGILKRELKGANGAITSMAVDHSLNYLITATTDQTVRVWNIDNGENLASFFFSEKNDWICWTPKGYYEASSGGEKYLGWHVNRGLTKFPNYYPAYVFSKRFHQGEVVKQALRLGNEKEALAYLDVKEATITEQDINILTDAPVITWISPETIESQAEKSRVIIKADISSISKINTVKILINGRPAPQSRGSASNPTASGDNKMLLEQEILLLNEINKIKIFVSNEHARTVSEERIITIDQSHLMEQSTSTTQLIDYTAKPDLYILSIGISDYANESYNLTFADDDAESIAALFSSFGKGAYKDIHADKVLNADATKNNILSAFARLHQNVTSKDVAVVFIASHGFNENNEFYILPHDGDSERLSETSINWSNISGTLGNLPGKVLLMVDACHSGQLGSDVQQTFSNNTEALREISDEENGVVIMSASTGNETSQEFADWGHGAFTLSVLEGLEQRKANIKEDLTIFLRELDFYVSERTVELTSGQQHPTTQKPSTISRFPIIIIDK